MIQLGIDESRRLYLMAGKAFAGDKGTTATVALPTMFGGLALSGFDTGYIYIKYGDTYEAIELAALSGTVEIEPADAVFAEAGTVKIWAEFSDTGGDLLQKSSVLSYIIETSETYTAPEASQETEPGTEEAGGTE